ncbi:hypothetical protein AGDE_13522 [Angomonas deanei]|nr:hypothetical protein AGDE_13522 [Angomonas deanei]|eukprot:EPY22242.1 hypothetical protein AGDE_13522 [Angomonas deanei]
MGLGVNEDGTLNYDLSLEFACPRKTVAVEDLKTFKPIDKAVENSPLILNVRNAPSPAATSAMSIAEDIVSHASKQFSW